MENEKEKNLISRPPVVVVLGHVDHGKCVVGNTFIPLASGEILPIEKIWGLYKKTGKPIYIKEEDKEGWVIPLKGLKVFSFNGEKAVIKEASHIWKLKAPLKLVEISLKSGDKLTVTPEHPLFVLTPQGIIKEKRADSITKNDFILVPQLLKGKSSITTVKKRLLQKLESTRNLVVFLTKEGNKKFSQKFKKTNKKELYRKKLLSNYFSYNLKKRRIRACDFVKIGRHLGFSDNELYEMIEFIKNATEKWQAGKTSNKIKWPKLPLHLEKLGYLIGCLTGDGQTKNGIFHNSDKTIQRVFKNYLKEVFGTTARIKKQKRCEAIVNSGYETFTRYLVNILDFPLKNKSQEIGFPSVFAGSLSFIKGFIAGWFDTDGYVSSINNYIEISSKSKRLVKEVSELLLFFGIHSVVFEKQTKIPNKNKITTYYYLRIANKPYLERFLKTFPIKHHLKKERLKKAVLKVTTSRIFDLTPISGENLSSFYIDENLLPYFSTYRTYKFLSRPFLEKLFKQKEIDNFPLIFSQPAVRHLLNPGEISCVKVKERKIIKNKKYKYVYDLTVPEFHNFVGERVFLHNTTLLDYIRKTKVAEKEAGGITQHIGAYEIEYKGKKITFIDTPGHEAFSKIRSRGARVADIAILVVAADEGVKPQTEESLKHIEEAKIPFLVAITKIDKEGANPDKVKRELLEKGVFLEGWGGDIPYVEVSAKTGERIDELLDLILLMAEFQNLKGDPNLPAQGVVIESFLDPKRGPTATVIITNGTLYLKDEIYAEGVCGKAKLMENFLGEPIQKATFSSPVRIIGFEEVPKVGAIFLSGKEINELKEEEKRFVRRNKILGEINANTRIPLIIKTDVLSSGEALEDLINKLGLKNNWAFNLIINETGNLTEGDLKLANLKGTLVILFRVKRTPEANNFLLNYPNLIVVEGEIIYEIEKKIEEIIKEKFIEKPKEEIFGKLEVLKVFNPIKGNQLIGGRVIEGKVINKNRFYLKRNEETIGEGKLLNLQKNKIDVNEVETFNECGLLVECKEEIKEGDLLEFFRKI